ncbi:MAG: glycosyltransferase family 4 protein, partial [Candidatus Hydrogenedentes bacterium]|nr:glycosyltransferase family 4 protein [Candidatus Hydrogenedentota bacterium]
VTVVAPHFPGMEEFDRAEPAQVVRFRGYGLGPLRVVPMAIRSWRLVCQADLVLGINVTHGGIIAYMANLVAKKPYALFAYGYEFLKYRHRPLMQSVLRAVYARARTVAAISRFTRDALAGFGVDDKRIAMILPGAPPAKPVADDVLERVRTKYVLEDRKVILSVGRLIPRKGHLALVRAMPRVLEQFPDACLIVVGRGPMMMECSRAACELGIRDAVRFPGYIPDSDVTALYALCDVFALPTGGDDDAHVEGFGLVFSEAHAHAKPVVAGRAGGVSDAVLDGETGLLVEPGDEESTAHALIRLLAHPELARTLGENGRKRVETELNWTVFTRRLLEAVGPLP